MRWFLIVLAALTLAVGATACGGDDESASDTTEITDSIDETTDETTTDEETTTDDETDTDIFAGGDCEELAAAGSAIGEVLSGASSGEEIDEASERFQDFVDAVPEEIRDDVQVLADVYAKYAEVFADFDLDAGETPTPEQAQELVAALATIDQAAVTEASTNLSTWSQENC